jgi:hypothetical protein
LRDGGDIGFFGKKVAEAAVEVFIGAFLPGAVGVAEIDFEVEFGFKLLIEGEFSALVDGDGAAQGWRQAAQDVIDTIDDYLTVFAWVFDDKDHSCPAFNEGGEVAVFADDEVAFEMAEMSSIINGL